MTGEHVAPNNTVLPWAPFRELPGTSSSIMSQWWSLPIRNEMWKSAVCWRRVLIGVAMDGTISTLIGIRFFRSEIRLMVHVAVSKCRIRSFLSPNAAS
ncbi:hypothetical protein DPMN_189160 [Dreissena polymorpha]|uniref:Uncharacterized protein n=1 Tax=Dreissena polymorpha TaxID=45954 RepID=A0A9D4DTU9_DREPO|nr:hypothetical protein DPMN_189160 [Dreissena polymorpha]